MKEEDKFLYWLLDRQDFYQKRNDHHSAILLDLIILVYSEFEEKPEYAAEKWCGYPTGMGVQKATSTKEAGPL